MSLSPSGSWSQPSTTVTWPTAGVFLPRPLDLAVLRLARGEWEEPEELMADLVRRLRNGEDNVLEDLYQVARGEIRRVESSCQALALETLAVARVPRFEDAVRRLILEFLAGDDSRLYLAAIAAASDLSPMGKALVRRAISRTTGEATEVRDAAQAFLRLNAPPGRATRR